MRFGAGIMFKSLQRFSATAILPLLKRVDIPVIGEEFYGNFYAREDAQIDFNKDSSKINTAGKTLLERIRDIGGAVTGDDYEKLQQASDVASEAINANHSTHDPEDLKHIEQDLETAKETLADIRERNRENIRRAELNYLRRRYGNYVKRFAEPQEKIQYENLLERAESLIEREDSSFEDTVSEMYSRNWEILFYRDDEYVVGTFNYLVKNIDDFNDKMRLYKLAGAGKNAITQKDYDTLRKVVLALYSIGGHKDDKELDTGVGMA